MRVLLTGGSGYLGQFLTDRLISDASFAVGTTYLSQPLGLHPDAEAFQVDFRDKASIKECIAKVITHLNPFLLQRLPQRIGRAHARQSIA